MSWGKPAFPEAVQGDSNPPPTDMVFARAPIQEHPSLSQLKKYIILKEQLQKI